MPSRLTFIDVAKGLSIFLVVLAHAVLPYETLDNGFYAFVEAGALYRIPLFFLLSGIFFCYMPAPQDFISKRANALLIPYFVALILLCCAYLAFSDKTFLHRFVHGLYGTGQTLDWEPMWFLPHLFVLHSFAYLLFRYTLLGNLPKPQQLLTISLLLCLGVAGIDLFWKKIFVLFGMQIYIPGLPYSVDVLLISNFYFMLGFILNNQLKTFIPNKIAVLFCLVIFCAIYTQTSAFINLNSRLYQAPLFAFIGSLTGIYLMLTVAFYLDKKASLRHVPIMLGKASLYILLFHWMVVKGALYYLSPYATSNAAKMGLALASVVVSILFSLSIKILTNKVTALMGKLKAHYRTQGI